jgi:hypothetical protein
MTQVTETAVAAATETASAAVAAPAGNFTEMWGSGAASPTTLGQMPAVQDIDDGFEVDFDEVPDSMLIPKGKYVLMVSEIRIEDADLMNGDGEDAAPVLDEVTQEPKQVPRLAVIKVDVKLNAATMTEMSRSVTTKFYIFGKTGKKSDFFLTKLKESVTKLATVGGLSKSELSAEISGAGGFVGWLRTNPLQGTMFLADVGIEHDKGGQFQDKNTVNFSSLRTVPAGIAAALSA